MYQRPQLQSLSKKKFEIGKIVGVEVIMLVQNIHHILPQSPNHPNSHPHHRLLRSKQATYSVRPPRPHSVSHPHSSTTH